MGARAQQDTWPTAKMRASSIAQAKALRKQAKKGGLRFNAYVPPRLAAWLLGLIEQGVFMDPSEAVFVILEEHRELEPHKDLRQELLKRLLQSAIDDPRPSIAGEEFFEKLRKKLAKPLPETATWKKSRKKAIGKSAR
jgi:antitoxin ParD1/3/4